MQSFLQEPALSFLIRLLEDFLIRLLEEGKNDTHSEALLRAYSVAGNIYFCPEMSRGEHLKNFNQKMTKIVAIEVDGSNLIVCRDRGSSAWRGEVSTKLVFSIPRPGLTDVKKNNWTVSTM